VDGYWGRNPFKLNSEAPGLILLLLAVVALCVQWKRRATALFFASLALFFLSMITTSAVQGIFTLLAVAGFLYSIAQARDLAFFLLVAVFSLFYSVGAHTPLYRLFFEIIPGVKFFRAPSTIMMLFLFSTASLAGFGADRIESSTGTPEGRRIVRALIGTVLGGAVLLVVLAVGREAFMNLWERFVYPDMGPRRAILEFNYPSFLKGTAGALLLAAGTAFCAWLIVSRTSSCGTRSFNRWPGIRICSECCRSRARRRTTGTTCRCSACRRSRVFTTIGSGSTMRSRRMGG